MSVALIMAGGFGKRLWPESSLTFPKQFLSLDGKSSLLRQTYERVRKFIEKERIYLVLREELKEQVKKEIPELPQENLILEPEGKDTAPCIGFAAVYIKKRLGDVPMLCLPADHLIREEEKFQEVAEVALKEAEEGWIVTIGIKPTRPETAYGYLEMGKKLKERDGHSVFRVKRFTEKPSYKKAKEFFERGRYLWNAGIFAWKLSRIIQEIEKYLPSLASNLKELEKYSQDREKVKEIYLCLPRISIDYGVMEKTDLAITIPGDFSWDDVGSWEAMERIFPQDEWGNVVRGVVKPIDSSGNILLNHEDKLLAVIGLSGVVVINSSRGVLVMSKERVQDVKALVDEILANNRLKRYAR